MSKIKGLLSKCYPCLDVMKFVWPEPIKCEYEWEVRAKGELADFTMNGEPVYYREDVFKLYGGPTGCESFYVEFDTRERQSKDGWVACAGTPGRLGSLVHSS